MAWIYQSDIDAACIEDHCKQRFISVIYHFPIEKDETRQIDFTELREVDGLLVGRIEEISGEEIERRMDIAERNPFLETRRELSMFPQTPYNPGDYDLTIQKRTGLVRRIWTEVPDKQYSNVTRAFHKIAGSGDTTDFYNMIRYSAERLPKIAEEVTNPQFNEIQTNMGWNAPHKSQSVHKIDWQKAQSEIMTDFYNMFKKSIEYCAVEPMEKLRLKPEDARELLQIISVLTKSPTNV